MANALKKKHPKIGKLIAEGREIDSTIKELSKKLNEIKDAIKAHARATEENQIVGDYGSAVFIDDMVSATIDIRALRDKLRRRPDDFLACVKVQIGKAETVLGKEEFTKLAKFKTTKFNKVTFGEVENYGEEK